MYVLSSRKLLWSNLVHLKQLLRFSFRNDLYQEAIWNFSAFFDLLSLTLK